MDRPARTLHRTPRLAVSALALLLAAAALPGCGGGKVNGPSAAAPRTYRMGFAPGGPRPDLAIIIESIQMWSRRSDAAILHEEPPWDSLLAGVPAESLVVRDKLPLANFFRGLGLRLVLMVDATNGLNRSADSQPLVDAGRSLTEPEIQSLYRRWCVVADSILDPDWMGLAAETNLIRAVASPALYAAVVQASAAAAADVRAIDPSVPLYVSVQVETAWGRLGGAGTYAGVDQDFADFPFTQMLGLSSYPYFGWTDPDSLPLDYYARLVMGRTTPVLVTEGGWSSASMPGFTSSPQTQARYYARHERILDQARAKAVFQLAFTDLDTTALKLPPGSILPLFSRIGLVDQNLAPKPALAIWDATHARPFVP